MRIELSCDNCGQNDFGLDQAENDTALISCDECGHLVGLLGQLKEQVAEKVLTSSARGCRRSSAEDPKV
jgi:uncharacterized Zn finger protein